MAETKDIFDSIVQSYDLWYDTEGKSLYESELKCVKTLVGKGRPLLEVGVGTGRFAMRFRGAFGIDPSLNALKIAKERRIKVVCGKGEALPFGDNVFRRILIIFTLCFVKSPENLLKEAKRVLRDKGRIIIGFIPKDSSWGRLYEKKKRKGHPIYGKANFYTFFQVVKFLDKIGLKVLRIRTTLLKPPDEFAKVERPIEGYLKGGGFVCVEVKKKQGLKSSDRKVPLDLKPPIHPEILRSRQFFSSPYRRHTARSQNCLRPCLSGDLAVYPKS